MYTYTEDFTDDTCYIYVITKFSKLRNRLEQESNYFSEIKKKHQSGFSLSSVGIGMKDNNNKERESE